MSRLFFNSQTSSGITPLQQRAVAEAYRTLYAFAGAQHDDHFVFTSSGAEAVNHAVFAGYADIARKTGKNHFLCSVIDEAPAIMAMGRLHDFGCVFQKIPEKLSTQTVAEMFTPRTAMLSLSWANGLTGAVQPVQEISSICRERGVLLHIDATHVLGKGDFTFSDSGADLLSFNGPSPGMGGLFIRSDLEISPLILGGHEQGGMRGGELDVTNLIASAKWAKEELSFRDHVTMEIARLRAFFEEQLCSQIPGARVVAQNQKRVPHLSCLLFPGVVSDALYYVLSQKGVHTSFGGGRFQHLCHILKACGICEPECHTGLSFALSHSIAQEEIEQGIASIVESVRQLQKCSHHLLLEAI